jgi:hypothetical protein
MDNTGGAPFVANCVFTGNTAPHGGGMANGIDRPGDPTVLNCTFSGNTADIGGGMLTAGDATVVNCTFQGNTEAGIGNVRGSPTVSNSILWGNSPYEIVDISGPGMTVRYSDVQGNWRGEGNIDADPLFADPGNDDYHLLPGSPCIGTGDPGTFGVGLVDLDGEPRVMGGRVDMGVDEFTDRPFVFGDMNCDGVRNGADIDPFFLGLGDPAAYAAQYPACNRMNGDCNDDGAFNGADIDVFFWYLGGGGCP